MGSEERDNTGDGSSESVVSEVRRLTPTECCRLMGIPDGHPFIHGKDTPDSSVYKIQGNGWARNCSRLVFKNIHKVDEKVTGVKKPFTFGTISSGQGTHELSVEDFGDKSIFCSDIDPFPVEVLKTRFPDTTNFGDMTRIDFDPSTGTLHNRKFDGYELMDADTLGFNPFDAPVSEIPYKFGDLDVVSGGTPCTCFSIAGKREGGAEGSGTRSALAFQLQRICGATGARWGVWENVPGAFSSNGGRDFIWFMYRFMKQGYTIAWRTLDAQFVRSDLHPRAVPQRRRRIWLVAYRGDDWRAPVQVLFEPKKVLGDLPPERVVGKGFTSLNPDYAQDRTEEQDATGSDPFGIFAEMGVSGKTRRQGEGLKESDLDLRLPSEGDIIKLSSASLLAWCKTVAKEIGYCGSLFQTRRREYDGDGKFVRWVLTDEESVDTIAEKALANIGNAGILSKGRIVTMKIPEWNAGITEEELATMPKELAELYDGDVCGLSDILEPEVDLKYQLSWRACWGILQRARTRGKELPVELSDALVSRIIEKAPFVKWAALYAKDTVKKEGSLSDRAIAKACWEEHIEPLIDWDSVTEQDPKSSDQSEDEDISDEEADLYIGESHEEE